MSILEKISKKLFPKYEWPTTHEGVDFRTMSHKELQKYFVCEIFGRPFNHGCSVGNASAMFSYLFEWVQIDEYRQQLRFRNLHDKEIHVETTLKVKTNNGFYYAIEENAMNYYVFDYNEYFDEDNKICADTEFGYIYIKYPTSICKCHFLFKPSYDFYGTSEVTILKGHVAILEIDYSPEAIESIKKQHNEYIQKKIIQEKEAQEAIFRA